MTPLSIPVITEHPRYLPVRAHPGDAGVDLKAYLPEGQVTLKPGEQRLIPAGIKMAIPMGWVGFVTPRSGMALKQRVRIGNSPGTIDAGYRNTVGVILWNNSDHPLLVDDGDRIAQLVVVPCFLGDFEPVTTLDDTERNLGGFGSTGI